MNLKDIAKQAGVSPACVSLVRNGRPGVGMKKRQKIQNLLYQNGFTYKDYEPDSFVLGSVRQERPDITHCIRLLKYRKHAMLVDGNEGFVSLIIDAIDAEARAQGYHVMMSTYGPNNQLDVIEATSHLPMDGVLIVATEMEQTDLEDLRRIRAPLVIIDSDFTGAPFSSITMNNREIAFSAVQRLHALGHPRIGYLRSRIETGNFFGRSRGYREAIETIGAKYDEEIIYSVRPTVNEAYLDMKQQLRAVRALPSAFFADNDTIAIGVMKALTERGVRIPQDISVIGVDDIPFGRINNPPLSTMRISCDAIGQWAVRSLLQQIQSPDSFDLKIYIAAQYVERGSTTAFRSGMRPCVYIAE